MKKEKDTEKSKLVLVTARVLFISVLDKIYLFIVALLFLIGTILIFKGNIASLNYGFFLRIGQEIILLIIMGLIFLILNWFYRCANKTILCLTSKEVYKEHYLPFIKTEVIIPLDKISKVSAINIFKIFRVIVIHQNNHFPLIFKTWNNQEFKDKLEELLTNDKRKIINNYKEKNIFSKKMIENLKYGALGILVLVLAIGVIRFFSYFFGFERKIAGTYSQNENRIILKNNGSCLVEGIVDELSDCSWSYDNTKAQVYLDYHYKYYSYYTYADSMILNYHADTKTLSYNNLILSK